MNTAPYTPPAKGPAPLRFLQRIKYNYEGQHIEAIVIGQTQRSLFVMNEKTPRHCRSITPGRITEIFND
jgi:hypothetical protein